MPWYLSLIISLTCGFIVTGMLFAYRWMDTVKDNHLAHIQSATEKTAANTAELNTVLKAHDRAEQEHHEEEIRLLSSLHK